MLHANIKNMGGPGDKAIYISSTHQRHSKFCTEDLLDRTNIHNYSNRDQCSPMSLCIFDRPEGLRLL